MMKKTIVINLIGGPCSGKSTTAAGVFYLLKKAGINCEMALEFAKDKVWEESFKTLDDQIYIFAKQYHKLWRLKDKVDVIITDSPLLLSLYFDKEKSYNFSNLILECYNKFDNVNYFLVPPQNYEESGRIQTKSEAREIGNELKNILIKNSISFKNYSVEQDDVVKKITSDVLNIINDEKIQ